ncbi:hypothetical protein EZV62_003379 [Acer yangbiense]|uniref:Jacalin-type lectin domain-containing protein n=1 Tax=Acer yangbiense TaxID=1000413 RepID=A0A5C7IHK3_9ROSI|nr:hypothetical protein EZV62_003379 [Acer yangbiense]
MVEQASFSQERSLNGFEAFQVGLWGEKKGREWSYKPKGAITGVMITCDSYAVVSLDFKGVDENGNTEYSDSFGYHKINAFKIMLDWPQEYFTSLSGTYYEGKANYYISSLSFTTNLKTYGPFGHPERSIPFEFPMNGKVIVGFYGQVVKENWIYGGLGVYVKNSTDFFGPSSQVQVTKLKTKMVISLNWPEEYLISISGTLRDDIKDIESLSFYTNQTIYGPFGVMEGLQPFRFYMKRGVIVGFHGCIGDYFDALGVYIKPFSELFSFSGQGEIENTNVKAGPFGGQGGKEWDYKPNGAITEIKISHGWVIDSVSFKSVDQHGKCEDSDRFGGEGGGTSLITINWPREYLTSISGTHYTFIKKQHVMGSLCFHTNKKKYGPFGCTQGSPFDLPLKDQVIVGFHGRASNYIDAIGVYQKGH